MGNQEIIELIRAGERQQGFQEEVREMLAEHPRTIVVLDDDPTGTQTMHDIPVVTQWTEEVLEAEIIHSPVFFILTNSRSLQSKEADALAYLLGKRLRKLAVRQRKELLVISRGDSTLRGHYPNEVNALSKGLGIPDARHIIAPAFFEGGRYTYNDVHYIKEGEILMPVGESPYARDNTFGFSSSNLKDWIAEKSGGSVKRSEIGSFSLEQLQNETPEKLLELLLKSNTSHLIVNALSYADLQLAALTILKLKTPFILRTAASFVNAISGIAPAHCLRKELIVDKTDEKTSALIIIGSYVEKTSAQLQHLKSFSNASFIELKVGNVIDAMQAERYLGSLSNQIEERLQSNQNVVLYTSRTLITGNSKEENLQIINTISGGLVSIVKRLTIRPRYILAKGGITSSDIATKGLGVKRAMVVGQVQKGVPVWKLGDESKFPALPYIVFPGNVGEENALTELTKLLE